MHQTPLQLGHELLVDNFAGGGGASTAIEQAFGRPVDIAINHNAEALALHKANHPHTQHYCESVWNILPTEVTHGRPVGLAWFSPDCKHFSKAKGGKPVEKHIRGLAWVAVRWAATVKPRMIVLENVEEFQDWGPLVDGRPCTQRKGRTFNSFVRRLQKLGYSVDWRELRASDYGTPTIRKRLFLIARCDGQPITWPEPTHGPGKHQQPFRTAAECIDWSLPCPSIFERQRPLADATLRRIAKGIMRYVVNNPEPFIVPIDHQSSNTPGFPLTDPLTTITSKARHALVSPVIARQFGNSIGHAATSPLGTITAGGGGTSQLVTAFLAKHYTGVVGQPLTAPTGTVTTKDHHAVVTCNLMKMRGTNIGQSMQEPLHTITAGGNHFAEVRAFLIKYYSTDQDPRLEEPLHTVTTKDRFGLVMVHGQPHVIVDIGMRMLQPRELFRAQGFPESYIINPEYNGKPLTKAAQVRMCGNSVCPPVARAIIEENLVRTAQGVAA